MNPLLPTAPLTQALGWSLLHLVWQGALVATMLAVVLPLLSGRSAQLRYAVSCLALATIVALGVGTGIRAYQAAAESRGAATATSRFTPPVRAARALAAIAPAPGSRARALLHAANAALPRIVLVWLAGVALFSARLVLEWLRARRLLTRNAISARPAGQEAARRLGAVLGVRQVVRVLESAAVEVPSVVGLVRPAILLPVSTLTGLTAAQLEMILAHELAHIRRHDFLVNLLQAVVETLLFYHPAVWWISRRIRIERENCCDDLAVAACGNRLQYARALLRLEELRATPAMAVSAKGGSLFDRIRRIALGANPEPGPAVRAAVALVVMVAVLLTIAAPSFSNVRRAAPIAKLLRRVGVVAVQPAPEVAGAAVPTGRVAFVSDPTPHTEIVAADEDEADTEAPSDDTEEAEPLAVEEGKPSLDDLIELRAQNVTAADVRELRAIFPRIRFKDIAGMKAVGATPEYVREMRAAGLAVDRPEDARGLAAVGVTREFLRGMRGAGLDVRSAQEAQGLAAVGVTPEFIRDMRASGMEVRSASEAQGLAAVGVTSEFIREMRSSGLDVKTAQDAQGLAAVGVTPRFLREMRAAGLAVDSPQDAQGLAAVGVTSAYVRELRAAGLEIRSADEAQGLAAVGVTPRYLRELRRAGVQIADAREVQSLAALGITSEFVQRLANAGYRDLTPKELQRLGAAGVNGDFIREMSRYRSR